MFHRNPFGVRLNNANAPQESLPRRDALGMEASKMEM